MGPPSGQAERGTPNQACSGHRHERPASTMVWVPWGRWGSRPGQRQGLVESPHEPQDPPGLLGLGLGPPGRGSGSGLSPRPRGKLWQERMAAQWAAVPGLERDRGRGGGPGGGWAGGRPAGRAYGRPRPSRWRVFTTSLSPASDFSSRAGSLQGERRGGTARHSSKGSAGALRPERKEDGWSGTQEQAKAGRGCTGGACGGRHRAALPGLLLSSPRGLRGVGGGLGPGGWGGA